MHHRTTRDCFTQTMPVRFSQWQYLYYLHYYTILHKLIYTETYLCVLVNRSLVFQAYRIVTYDCSPGARGIKVYVY